MDILEQEIRIELKKKEELLKEEKNKKRQEIFRALEEEEEQELMKRKTEFLVNFFFLGLFLILSLLSLMNH